MAVELGWSPAIRRYTEHLHAVARHDHHVVSGLGAWLVLALAGPLAEGGVRDELARALGADPSAAFSLADALLVHPHPVVPAGAGIWVRSGYETDRVRDWVVGLPSPVDTGDIPTQAALDAWATERTLQLIRHFPIDISADVICLLASALATRVSWELPFSVVDSSYLGTSPWSREVAKVLEAPRADPRHPQFLVSSDRAGPVAVHLARARDRLVVGSVIAEDASVSRAEVLAVAQEIVCAEAVEQGSAPRLSLFDIPVGNGPIWDVSEERIDTPDPDGREEQVSSVLPAWEAETRLDLARDRLGFPAAARAVGTALGMTGLRYDANQSALARYSAVGFEAAAVTALAVRVSRPMMRPGRRRIARVRFGHPYAAVAVAVASNRDRGTGLPTRWHGMPVFSAWVTEPRSAEGAVS